MKVYVATRFRAKENDESAELLCKAVHDAKMVPFNFIRDSEHHSRAQKDNPQELWERVRDEVLACDAFLVDVSDYPSGGRLVEMGIAYTKRIPIIVVKKRGVSHEVIFDGVATAIIEYGDFKDLTRQLTQFDSERHFTVNDQMSMLAMLVLTGILIGWGASQIFIPLGPIVAIAYWLLLRLVLPSLRTYDRLVVYVPLIAIWLLGYFLLEPIYAPLAIAWLIIFWFITLFVLRKIKFSI